jgi:hypothetical protein
MYRTSHLKFVGKTPALKTSNDYDRVVTVDWEYLEGTLRYGASVYTREIRDNWIKKIHFEKAKKRLKESPVLIIINLSGVNETSVDWYIARKLIYEYGCKSHTPNVKYVHDIVTTWEVEKYNPYLTGEFIQAKLIDGVLWNTYSGVNKYLGDNKKNHSTCIYLTMINLGMVLICELGWFYYRFFI